MNGQDIFITEFDEQRRILHFSYRRRIHPVTDEQLDNIFARFHQLLDTFTQSGRIYLIIDMTNLIIEPELKAAYIAHARAITEKYIFPRGIARYGYQITRITVRAGYQQYTDQPPNIFNSREEAYKYIYSLIEKNDSQMKEPSITASTGDFAGR